ncbi:hybrid sensor histidine kinase/response regulator [Lyngbya sp. CCY1209]|jgi:signal transduction histidine kinase|uniref:ATP-binding response regulator n=1 Tax=Lyngbya sp. CCY1209 TaxID=2886103 RepID=UPI002D216798|nr:hybrid sensor histidine kinase/response regulator [Lyngbya sp. CCY1209]MEB3883537.1 hybrid sensor histidine kinase/response regulator [Lyngbya sp. CCY1209]
MFSSTQPPTGPSDSILAVDDSPDNLFLIDAILGEAGYRVCCQADGASALKSLESNPPKLILLDVMMPGIDGYEVTRRIRNNPHLPFIPILLITAYDQSSVVEGLDAGADDFIRKPVEVDELLARVRSLLRLKHSIDEQTKMSRQREDFVSRLTHDLRTPLVAADRMLQLFRQGALGELTPPMQEAVRTMIGSNQNLLRMVNTLLEVYRYEAGRKTLAFSTVDLSELIREVVEELTPLAQEKGLKMAPDRIEPAIAVVGDPLELRRVAMNLVGNAIKFTDAGHIDVRLRMRSSEAILEVEDTGEGMSEADRAIIFQRFRQGKHKRSGSGLGLHLAARIVAAHDGSIDVQSEPGRGSHFTVRLPLKSP